MIILLVYYSHSTIPYSTLLLYSSYYYVLLEKFSFFCAEIYTYRMTKSFGPAKTQKQDI